MVKHNFTTENYISRYEKVMYQNSSHATNARKGYELGQKYAKSIKTNSVGISFDEMIAIARTLKVPSPLPTTGQCVKVYRLSYALGYLKQLGLYDTSNKEQERVLDSFIS